MTTPSTVTISSVTNSPDTDQPKPHGPTVVVAIVNYCTPDLTIDCLRSLSEEIDDFPGMSVFIADNASPDGSGKLISNAIVDNGWSSWAKVLLQPINGGFAYGNNAIIKPHLEPNPPDFFWLLNSDTVVRQGALRALLNFMDEHPKVGITGSCLEDPDGTQQCSAFRFHSMASEFEASIQLGPITKLLNRWAVAPALERKTAPFDWVAGASMLVRKEVFDQVGLMDENYFLYYEETDFCGRAKKLGWACWYVVESRVIHLVGKSSGVTVREITTKRRSSYWFESRRLYFIKNHGRLYAIGADLALGLGTLLWQIRTLISNKPSTTPKYFLYDLARHSALLGTATGNVPH